MEPDAIKDGESLEAWLQDRPPEDAMAIAHRTALRVHSLWSDAMEYEWVRKTDLTALPVLRLYLTSGVARKYPTPEVKAASTATRAASASATADRAASSASTAAAEIWEQIRIDAAALLAGLDLSQRPLWSDTPPYWFTVADRNARAIWAKAPEPWHFWLRWWDGVLSGQQLDWELQKAVALIADEDWEKGPERIAEVIAEIEADHKADPDAEDIDALVARMPPAAKATIETFATAIARHRDDLPATLDAILGFCALEIERLQRKNYQSDDERDEAKRQIRALLTIHSAVSRLQVVIPPEGALTDEALIKAEKLSRVFIDAFKAWPRKNADDLVDSVCRAALVGITATVLPMIGASVNLAVGAGVILFGGKKVADGLKAAKDLAPSIP